MEEIRQAEVVRAARMEEISPPSLQRERKGRSAISHSRNFRAPFPPTKLSVIITDGG